MNKPLSIYKNTAFLSALSVLERSLGFFYRIVLARLLGAEGLGVYQIAVSHFFLLRTLGGGGIPVTLSRTVAKNNAENHGEKNGAALIAALSLTLLITLPLTMFILLFADKIAFFDGDGGLLKILVVGLSFTGAYAAIKGFFWGNKEFVAPALFEFFEEIAMTVVGAALLLSVKDFSPERGAGLAAIAMTAACVFSFALALVTLLTKKIKFSSPLPELKPLIASAAPVTAIRAGSTLISSAVAVLLPAALVRAGMTESEALQAFGVATGMVLPLLTMPMTVVGSLATVLVPTMSEAFHKRNFKALTASVERGLTFTVLLACGLLPLFNAVGYDLGAVAYGNLLAGEMLQKSGILLLPMSLCAISQSMVNSLGFEKQSFAFSCVGSALFLACVVFLPRVFGVYAYLVGLGVEFTAVTACSLTCLFKRCPPKKTFFVKSFLALALTLPVSLFGNAATDVLQRTLGEIPALLISGLLIAAVTVGLFAAFRLFSKRELKKNL